MTDYRLEGLEPDNLLAFMAMLGLLRSLEEVKPKWHPRIYWTVNQLPLRPALRVPRSTDKSTIAETTAKGLAILSKSHKFSGAKKLALSPTEATRKLRQAADRTKYNGYAAELWSSLVSDAAITHDGKAEPTPLCLMSGQGRQYFLSRLESVPQLNIPPKRGNGLIISEADCLSEALFAPWQRPDATDSFRWDPYEDVRHALRARDPTDVSTRDKTQHGANRLAAIGLSVLTVTPRRRLSNIKLSVVGGEREIGGGFTFRWPIWREPVSLAGIRALLGHPGLGDHEANTTLGVVEVRRARRISSGKFMNFTRAETNAVP